MDEVLFFIGTRMPWQVFLLYMRSRLQNFQGHSVYHEPRKLRRHATVLNPEGIDPLTDLLEVATVIDANRRTLQLSKAGCYLRLRTWFESSQRCGQIRH